MRLGVLALVIALTGCVSQTQPGNYSGDDFDMEKAAKTRISLGLTYLKNGNYQQAKMNLDKALEFAPRYADAHYSLAYYYQTVEEWDRAEQSFEDALDLAPRNAEIANSYGAFLCQQKKYDKANEFYQKALNNLQYANSAQTYENMAICADEQGHTEQAISNLISALNHQPGRSKSLYLLTQLYVKTEQWDKAEATMRRYERVSRVSPESIQLAISIAEGQGDYDTAAGYGEMLTTMYPQSDAAEAFRQEMISRANQNAQIVRRVKENTKEAKVIAPPAKDDTSTEQSEINKEKDPSAYIDNSQEAASVSNNEVNSDEKTAFHVVKPGENLYRISLKYNIKMASIQEWNNLDDPGDIEVGMRLRLSPRQ